MKETPVTDKEVGKLVLNYIREKYVLSSTNIKRIVDEWDKPRYEEFKPRTLWSLQNACAEVFKKIKEQNHIVAFCGDGLNDAPVINLSDVSFVMGKKGSALSVESADIIVMNDSLESVRKCFVISKRIYKIK